MPCQLCKSPNHTLSKCNSEEAQDMFKEVDNFMQVNKLRIVEQIECLQNKTLPQVKFIGKRLRTGITGRKTELICNIINKYFDSVASYRHYPSLTADDLERINDSYTQLYEYVSLEPQQMPYAYEIVSSAYKRLRCFYLGRYGPERIGVPLVMYLGSLNYRANHNPMSLSHYELRERLGEARATAIERAYYEQISVVRRADYMGLGMALQMFPGQLMEPQPQKLTFHVEVDETLVQSKECCICYEDMMPVKLGCSHETCLDCLCGIANAKKKSNPVITCAMCRADIDIVYVTSEEIKTELKQKIDVV